MNSTIFYLYTSNVIFSLCAILCIFKYYTIDYSLIQLSNSYYFYWFTTFLSFVYGFLETCFLYQYNSIDTLRERYTYFPYFLFIASLFLNISWLISSIFSSLILQDCTSKYDNCDTIIALTVFGFLEFIVWSSVWSLLVYYIYIHKREVTVRERSSDGSSSPEMVIRDVGQQRMQICHPPSVESHRAEILEMEEIQL